MLGVEYMHPILIIIAIVIVVVVVVIINIIIIIMASKNTLGSDLGQYMQTRTETAQVKG